MKEKMIKFIKRYRIFFLLLIINTAVLVIFPNLGKKAFQLTGSNLLEMLSVLPPIFILLGLLNGYTSTNRRYLAPSRSWRKTLVRACSFALPAARN